MTPVRLITAHGTSVRVHGTTGWKRGRDVVVIREVYPRVRGHDGRLEECVSRRKGRGRGERGRGTEREREREREGEGTLLVLLNVQATCTCT